MYSRVEVSQIEGSDVPAIKTLLNAFRVYLPEHRELTDENVADQYLRYVPRSSYHMLFRGSNESGLRLYVLGLCSITNIDWVSRHAELSLVVHGDGHTKGTLPNNEDGRLCLSRAVEYCFGELGLQKIEIEVLEDNDIKPMLEQAGFVAEGVRRHSRFKRGEFIDSTICSLLLEEYK